MCPRISHQRLSWHLKAVIILGPCRVVIKFELLRQSLWSSEDGRIMLGGAVMALGGQWSFIGLGGQSVYWSQEGSNDGLGRVVITGLVGWLLTYYILGS